MSTSATSSNNDFWPTWVNSLPGEFVARQPKILEAKYRCITCDTKVTVPYLEGLGRPVQVNCPACLGSCYFIEDIPAKPASPRKGKLIGGVPVKQ